MGNPEGTGHADDGPQRFIRLDAFQVDQVGVTTGRYPAVVRDSGHRNPPAGYDPDSCKHMPDSNPKDQKT